MKTKNTNLLAQASAKSSETLRLEETLPLLDVILDLKQDIEAVTAEVGLKIMHRYMEQELERRCGRWGSSWRMRMALSPREISMR